MDLFKGRQLCIIRVSISGLSVKRENIEWIILWERDWNLYNFLQLNSTKLENSKASYTKLYLIREKSSKNFLAYFSG